MIRLLIVEDEIIIARYIQQLLNDEFEWNIKIALTAEEARDEVTQFLPHLILCDINLNEKETGITLISDLQKDYTFETIFITSYQSKSMIEKASLIRPANYIIKPFDESQFIATLKMAEKRLQGDKSLGAKMHNLKSLLSKMELDVLMQIADNKSSKEIAESLYISPATVKNHRHNISRKLNLSSENNALSKWLVENKGLF